MNKTKEMLEIIEGFQNLTSKIKDDNESIKKSLKNKDLTILACKNEYKKLHAEYEELKQKYVKLEAELEQSKKTANVERIRKRKKTNVNKVNKKKIILDYDSEAEDERSTTEDEANDENDENENDYEIVKIKKNKKKKPVKQQKKKIKGIIDYINNKNN